MFRWKALIMVAVVCLMASSAFAQTDATNKGNYMLGGSASWTSMDNENATERMNTWVLSPVGMYFAADNFGIGLRAGFLGASQGDFGASTHRYLGIGQYVFTTNNEMFRPFIQAGGGFSRMTVQDPAGDIVFNGWAFTGGVGAHMFVNEHVAITPEISYVYETFSDDGTLSRGNDQTIFVGMGINGFILP